MVEWFKAHAWKACDVKASAGSNPVLCATIFKVICSGFEPLVRPVGPDRAGALPALAKNNKLLLFYKRVAPVLCATNKTACFLIVLLVTKLYLCMRFILIPREALCLLLWEP